MYFKAKYIDKFAHNKAYQCGCITWEYIIDPGTNKYIEDNIKEFFLLEKKFKDLYKKKQENMKQIKIKNLPWKYIWSISRSFCRMFFEEIFSKMFNLFNV